MTLKTLLCFGVYSAATAALCSCGGYASAPPQDAGSLPQAAFRDTPAEPAVDASPGVIKVTRTISRVLPKPASTADPSAYVYESAGDLVAIDENTDQIVAEIELPYPLVFGALDLVNSKNYVLGDDGTIRVINTVSNVISSDFAIPGGAKAIAASADGSIGYAVQDPNLLVKLDLPDEEVLSPVVVGNSVKRVVFSPASSSPPYTAYVSWGAGAGSLGEIDGSTNAIAGIIPTGSQPYNLGINPSATRVYIVNGSKFTTTPQKVYVVDLTKNKQIASIPIPSHSGPIAVSRDGTYAYVASDPVSNSTYGSIEKIDLVTNKNVGKLTVPHLCGPAGGGINFSRDGTKAFLPCANNVYVISTSTFSITAAIPLNGSGWDFGIWAQ